MKTHWAQERRQEQLGNWEYYLHHHQFIFNIIYLLCGCILMWVTWPISGFALGGVLCVVLYNYVAVITRQGR